MHLRFTSLLLPFSFAISSITAQATLGGACDPTVDFFGCQGTNYLTCDPTSKRWITQNVCPVDCLQVPSFAANCGRNSQGVTSTTSNSTTPSSTSTPISTPNSSSSSSSTSPSYSSSSSSKTAAIVAPIVVILVLAILGFLAFIYYRKRRASESAETPAIVHAEMTAGKPLSPADRHVLVNTNVTSVLEKRYQVAHDYSPTAEDEIPLKVGDTVRLTLLFNDGWAKGLNESTGQQGLLPCACIQEITVA